MQSVKGYSGANWTTLEDKTIDQQIIGEINMKLNRCKVSAAITAEGYITVRESSVLDTVTSRGTIIADDCQNLADLVASREIVIRNGKTVGAVSSSTEVATRKHRDRNGVAIVSSDGLVCRMTEFESGVKRRGGVTAKSCETLGAVSALLFANLIGCKQVASVKTRDLTLSGTCVLGDVNVKFIKTMQDSKVLGAMTASNRILQLHNSTCRTLILEPHEPSIDERPIHLHVSSFVAANLRLLDEPIDWEQLFRDGIADLYEANTGNEIMPVKGSILHFPGLVNFPDDFLRYVTYTDRCDDGRILSLRIKGLDYGYKPTHWQDGSTTITIARRQLTIPRLDELKAYYQKANVKKANQLVILDGSRVHTVRFQGPGGVVKLVNNAFVAHVANGYVYGRQPDPFTLGAAEVGLKAIYPAWPKDVCTLIGGYLDRAAGVALALTSKGALENAKKLEQAGKDQKDGGQVL